MDITPKFAFADGSFDTTNCKMLCIASDNHTGSESGKEWLDEFRKVMNE